jgi:hypothetical protein
MITMNRRTARAAGYRPLTSRYYLPEEQEMLDGVLADMRRGNISHALVRDRLGIEVWRTLRSATIRSGTMRTATRRVAA